MHPCCRLAVSLVPSELAADVDVEGFVRSCYFYVSVLRFQYAPAPGEDLDAVSQSRWATALQQHGYRGTVIFRPRTGETDRLSEVCARIDHWAELYAGTP
jgi:hypothetical protein